jgi:lipopolysaccharide transport system permease protein
MLISRFRGAKKRLKSLPRRDEPEGISLETATMTVSPAKVSSPIPSTIIEPPSGRVRLNLGELWAYRDLLYILVWRDIKIIYKQTVIGVAWAVVQPVLSAIVFSVLFGRLVGVSSEGVPYPLFVFCGLVPWSYLSHVLPRATNSLVNNYDLITKVYFPRALVPLVPVLVALIDFAIAFSLLLVLMAVYRVVPTLAVLTLPLFFTLLLALTFGAGLWLSAINVEYRDVGNIVPFMFQVWLFVTPVFYPSQLVPEPWRWLYSLNPMVSVIEGFRWALLGATQPAPGPWLAVSVLSVCVILVGGLLVFRRREDAFADIV